MIYSLYILMNMQNLKKLKKLYALPDMRTVEEKEADFGKAFW